MLGNDQGDAKEKTASKKSCFAISVMKKNPHIFEMLTGGVEIKQLMSS